MALVRKSAPYPLTAYVSRRDEDGKDVRFFRILLMPNREVLPVCACLRAERQANRATAGSSSMMYTIGSDCIGQFSLS